MKTTLTMLLACASMAAGAQVDDRLAIRAIVGEAANCDHETKLAVACAIRNRGTLDGVLGLTARHVDTEPAWVWRDAEAAWKRSATEDVTRGAAWFGTDADVATGVYTGLTETLIVGSGRKRMHFFKR